jgi:hypothetical protein
LAFAWKPGLSVMEKKPSREGGRALLVVLFVIYFGLLAPS